MTEIDSFLRRLPKAELHLHLEGAVLPATLVELSERHPDTPITLAEAEALYRFTDFSGFLVAYKAVCARLITPEDWELAAWRMAERLAEQGVVHAEVFLSVGVLYRWGPGGNRPLTPESFPPVFEAIFAGLERARLRAEQQLGLTLYWIFDAVRHFTVDEARLVFEAAARMRRIHPSIVGIGLGGDERQTGSEPFRELYAAARAAGLRLTNHAGETTGPEAICEALAIGSERLGHALSAIRDPDLVAGLKARQIPLELNPSSNIRTGLCASFAAHPLRSYFDAGLMVTLNSDDPAFFGSDIEMEYRKAYTEQGFTQDELRQIASNSIVASFLPEDAKRLWLSRIESTQ